MLSIRFAKLEDATLLTTLIREFAEYDRLGNEAMVVEEDVVRDAFGPKPKFRALIAEWDAQPAGFALFFGYYSTWRGAGLYLEDLFVRPDFRGHGIGTALLAQVAQIARQENRILLRWAVLHWNKPAIEMYKALGGYFLDDWRDVLLMGDALHKLADKAS